MSARQPRSKNSKRRGAVAAMTAISLPILIGFAALTVDVGMLYNARAELQRSADAAALAAAWELLDEDRLTGTPNMTSELLAARQAAASYAALNPVGKVNPVVDLNNANSLDGDVVVGYLSDPTDRNAELSTASPASFNSVRVRVRRDSVRNGPIDLVFGAALGIRTCNMAAEAIAMLGDAVVGFSVPPGAPNGNAHLLPFALHIDSWEALLDGTSTFGDNYSYDEDRGAVLAVSDGIPELNLYPGAGVTQLPPGNFGTVDIGNTNNSTNDIKRQILYGVNDSDLNREPFWGQVKLGPDGTLSLQADTGLSAGFKDELEAIKGQPRAILLFNAVAGPGNNAIYTVVGFAGIRIVSVKLTGAMSKKEVVIQPAFVVDDTAITEPGTDHSDYVYRPPQLVR